MGSDTLRSGMVKPSVAWYQDSRSANPMPVCRRGGCGLLAVEGSEWCAVHDVEVRAGQEWAVSARDHLRREHQATAQSRALSGGTVRCHSCSIRRVRWLIDSTPAERDGVLHHVDELGRPLCEGV